MKTNKKEFVYFSYSHPTEKSLGYVRIPKNSLDYTKMIDWLIDNNYTIQKSTKAEFESVDYKTRDLSDFKDWINKL